MYSKKPVTVFCQIIEGHMPYKKGSAAIHSTALWGYYYLGLIFALKRIGSHA